MIESASLERFLAWVESNNMEFKEASYNGFIIFEGRICSSHFLSLSVCMA